MHNRFIPTFGFKNGKYPRIGNPQGPGSFWVEVSNRSQIVFIIEKQFVTKHKMKYQKYFLASQTVANTKHSTIMTNLKLSMYL